MEKTEYHVVEHWSFSEFVKKVQQHLDWGWRLQGGVALAANDGGNTKGYAQAVVRTVGEGK